jgi:BirA family transcriptional regulator, biotin operon repressor / biotin---[acetyl-CoA-carboxylase] ligase
LAACVRRNAMTKAALIERVFAKLTDGEFHSGQELARGLGVTRSAVWKAAGSLRELGMPLEAIRNRGYRLAVATEPLDAVRIRSALPREILTRVRKLEVEWSVDSTNTQLVARESPPAGVAEVLLAEVQSAGRGRRGRAWLAPPGGAVCLSLSWTFPEMPRDVGALSLAIGVCMLRALKSAGVADVRLKWPNDVLVGDRKLGGILIELRAESAGPVSVVVGIGLNVALGDELLEKIATTGLYATDLHSAIADGADAPRGSGSHPTLSRNAVAAAVIEQCIRGLAEFEREGLRPFVEEWRRADALRGRDVTVHSAEVGARGLARGIDLSGALLVETPHGLRKFIGGEVTVRPET